MASSFCNPSRLSSLLGRTFPSWLARKPPSSSFSWIRMMGGGPRTYPGGVSKWQWKRMLEKKRKDIEKSKLLRERQIYKMRRRAELLAAHPELEQPWEKLATFPSNHVSADEQIRTLAGRFEKPGGEDLWTDRDGPEEHDGQPSAAVHSSRMYQKVGSSAAHQSGYGGSSTRFSGMDGADSRGMKWKEGSSRAWPNKLEDSSRRESTKPVMSKDTSTKNYEDYFDSFESDPLGLSSTRGPGRSKNGNHD